MDLLYNEEIEWILRSRFIWLDVEDNNTQFFHNFANFRKSLNTILQVALSDGNKVRSFGDIAREAKDHFQTLFKDPKAPNIDYLMKVIRLFQVYLIKR